MLKIPVGLELNKGMLSISNKNNANINLPMEYKATIYENAQGMIFIRILDANNKTIFRKTSKNLDDIIKVLNVYMI